MDLRDDYGIVARLTTTRRGRQLSKVVFYSAAILLGIPLAFSQVMIGTVRQPIHPPPAGYEEVWVSCEGLRLRVWIARGDASRTAAVVVHGLGDSLESYVEVASVLHRRGHTALLLDLRGHGGSEGSQTTLGGREREDVRAAMRALRERRLAPAGFLLMGYSMGAVAVLRAAAEEPDVRAVVAEAPFDTYRASMAHHARLLYHLPEWTPLIPVAIAFAEWRAGFDADDTDAVAAARKIRVPLLLVADGGDPRMPEAVVRRVLDAHPGPKALWVAPGAPHVGAILRSDYWPTVLGFLEKNLASP